MIFPYLFVLLLPLQSKFINQKAHKSKKLEKIIRNIKKKKKNEKDQSEDTFSVEIGKKSLAHKKEANTAKIMQNTPEIVIITKRSR